MPRRLTIDRLRDHRLPAIYQWPETAEDGGLLLKPFTVQVPARSSPRNQVRRQA
jgi:hypothetical protein